MFLKYFTILVCYVNWRSDGKLRSGNHREIKLETDSRNVTVKYRSPLHLNCTIPNTTDHLTSNELLWSRGTTRMSFNTRKLNNKTLQLSINNTSWNDSGEYWCTGLKDVKTLGVKVTVIVADVPSSPKNIYWTNFELLPQISWTAASYDGGLPVKYYIYYQCHGQEECTSAEVYEPCECKHFPYRRYNCLVRYIAEEVRYSVWVAAVNTVGMTNSKKLDVFVAFNDLASAHTFPPPNIPKHMVVPTPSTQRSITVRLTRNSNWNSYGTIFNVTYRRKGDSDYQVWYNRTQSDYLTLHGNLKPYTMYEVLISACLVNTYGQRSIISQPIGPFLARTAEEAPSVGPTIVNCSAVPWHGNKMNVIILWKPLAAAMLNGILKKYVLIYVSKRGSFQHIIPVNNNNLLTMATIPGLNSSSSYNIWIQACTVECGPSSESKCTVSLPLETPTIEAADNTILIAMTVLSLFVLAAAVLVWLLYKKTHRQSSSHHQGQRLLERFEVEGPNALHTSTQVLSENHPYESVLEEEEENSPA